MHARVEVYNTSQNISHEETACLYV